MTYFTQRLNDLRQRIELACEISARDPREIALVAVSKRHGLDRINEAIDAGHKDFGENLIQEAVPKIIASRGNELVWHFIGHLQSNKTREAATYFDWVHTVDRPKIARRLNDQRPESAAPLQVCIQVHIGDEASKSGIAPAGVPALAEEIRRYPRLRLRGLMAIPPPADDMDTQRAYFSILREIKMGLESSGYDLDTLSAGMSDDLEAAIAEGSTMLRIGTDLFGPRPTTPGTG